MFHTAIKLLKILARTMRTAKRVSNAYLDDLIGFKFQTRVFRLGYRYAFRLVHVTIDSDKREETKVLSL